MDFKSIPIENIKSKVFLVDGDLSVSKLIGKLSNLRRYEAFTISNGRVHIIGLRDILNTSDILGQKISSLSWPIPALNKSSILIDAIELMMKYKVRSIPLIENRVIFSEVTCSAILSEGGKIGLLDLPVSRIMTSNIISIDGGDSLSKGRKLMIEHQIDHLPVILRSELKGMLTSADIIARMVPKGSPRKGMIIPESIRKFEYKVGAMISANPLTSNPDERAFKVLNRMEKRLLDYAIITLGDEIQGIVTYRDFLRSIAPQTTPEPPLYMIGLPDDPFESETAKTKFKNAIISLTKIFPDIIEARTTIKHTRKYPTKERRYYEVDVSIKKRSGLLSFRDEGWDLPEIYDKISDRIKRILSKKIKRRR